MAFNTQKARAAGYSDAEIADYLGKDSGFDTTKARQAGYTDAELVTHLSSLAPKAAEPSLLDRVKNGLAHPIDTLRDMDAEAAAADEKRNSVVAGQDGVATQTNTSSAAHAALAGVLPSVATNDAAKKADYSLGGAPVRAGVVPARANKLANEPVDMQQAAASQPGVEGRINQEALAIGDKNVIAPAIKQAMAASDQQLLQKPEDAQTTQAVRDKAYGATVDSAMADTSEQQVFKDMASKDKHGAARYWGDYEGGVVGSTGSTLSYVGRKTGADTLAELGDSMNSWARGVQPTNPTFADNLVGAVGSMASFYIPGIGVEAGATALAKLTPVMAKWAGAGAMAGLEASAEADGVYKELKQKGLTEEEAMAQADKSFMANMVLLGVTDKAAFFNDIKVFNSATGKIDWRSAGKKWLGAAAIEGPGQEAPQQFIQNYLTGHPITEGAGEAALIGSIVGGGATAVHTIAQANAVSNTSLPVVEAINSLLDGGHYASLTDGNLAQLHAAAQRVETQEPGTVGVSQIEAEMQRRATLGTLERAKEAADFEAHPVNQGIAAAQEDRGTLANAAASVPPGAAVTPEAQPEALAPMDVKAEHLAGMTPEERNHWANNVPADQVQSTLSSIKDPQARADAVSSLGLSDRAAAQLHSVLSGNETKSADFQQLHADDLNLLNSVNAHVDGRQNDGIQDSSQASLPDLGVQTYGQYIARTNARLAQHAELTQDRTGQAPFSIHPVSQEHGQAFAPLSIAIHDAFGTEVVPFSSPDAHAPDGFEWDGVAHVNIDNLQRPAAWVVGHEFGHTMENSASESDRNTADWLRKQLVPMISEDGRRKYAEQFLFKATQDTPGLTLEQVYASPELTKQLHSEMVQDFLGKRMTDREFLDNLAKKDPVGFGGFVKKWIAALDKMIASLHGQSHANAVDLDEHIKDLVKAKNLAQTAMIKWRKAAMEREAATAKAETKAAAKTSSESVDKVATPQAIVEITPNDAHTSEPVFAKRDDEKFSVLKREKASGRYVGAPDWVGSSTAEVAKLYKKVKGMAIEGESGKLWYEKSSKAVLDLVGGDKAEAEKFVGLLAIYSQGTEVGVNTGFALEAYYQWKAGLPIKTGRFPTEQTKKANLWLKEGKDWGGIKTNNFYVDLMEEINPAHVDDSHATMDMWMALAYDYGMKVLDQGPKYAFAKTMTELIAKDLSWKPHQVQAAIWSSIKTRIEATEKERVALERKTGIQIDNGDGTWSYAKGREYDHFRLAHKLGMKLQITPEEIAAKGFNYEDALNQRMIQMSWEATPSVTAGTIPGIHKATLPQKMEYLESVAKALTENGKNLIAEAVGLHSPPTLFGVSAWEGQVGAGAQSFLPAPVLGTKGKRSVLPIARNLLNDYSALMGLVLKQDAVVWHHPVYDDIQARANGVELVTNRALTAAEIELLYPRVYAKFGTWEIAPGYTASGVKLLNFVEGLDNKTFQKGMQEIIDSLPEDFGGGAADFKSFRSDGDYISNDWKRSPSGEDYIETLRARRPDLLARAADLRARVETVDREFDKKYGWGGPSLAKRVDGGRSQGSTEPATSPREGAARVSGTHFSNQERQSLDGRFYGTGIKGAEQDRISRATDRRLKSRLYFYVNEGKGVRPEAGVGKIAHNVDISNLYNTSTRTLTWAKDPYGDNAVTMNNFESAVLDAGYSGYYRPAAFGDQGVAVLLGDAAVGVKPTTAPQMAKKWTEVSQLVMINEVAKNKKTWGKHIDEKQIKRVDQESDAGFKAKNAGQKLNAEYINAAKHKDTYDGYVKAIAENLGLEAKVAGLKGRKRTVEKLIADYGSDVSKLKDMLRATIETESLTQARELYEVLREVAPLAAVAGNDKSSLDPSRPAASESGYRDAKLIIDIGGVPAELIIAPATLLRAKDVAHSIYDDARTIEIMMRTASVAQRNKLGARLDALNTKMAEIYAPAVERSQSSSASLRVRGTELSRELKELQSLLSGSKANLNGYLSSGDSGISAIGMPSKSKNLVPSGNSESGVLASDMVDSSNANSIPQGKDSIQFAKRFQPTGHEDYSKALTAVETAHRTGAMEKLGAFMRISDTPAALKSVKAFRPGLFVVGKGSTVYLKGVNQHQASSHAAAVPMDVLHDLPSLLADPIAIYDKAAFDKANPKAANPEGPLYLVVLPVKVAGEYVTVAIAPGTKVAGTVVNFVKSVHTRAAKTLNQYAKFMVYEGVTDRHKNEEPNRRDKPLDTSPLVQLSGSTNAASLGTDVTIRQAKGIDKPKTRNDIPSFAQRPTLDLAPEETNLEAAARMSQDKFNRFKVLQDWLKSQGTKLSEAGDVYLAETLMSGRVASRKEDFRTDVMGPLIKKTQAAGVTMEQVGDFLKMQHAPEANKRARDIQGKPDATAFGVSDKAASDAMAEFQKLPNFKELKALANGWRGITTSTKDILLQAGILSPEMAAAWDNTYSVYVPVKGTDEDAAAKTGTGKGLNVNGRNKQRMGHDLRDEAIIENILRDHEKAIALDEKNRVGKSLIQFALEAKNDDIITVGKPVQRKVLKQGQSAYMVTYHGSDIAAFDSFKDAQAFIAQAVLKAGGTQTGSKAGYAIAKTSDPVRVMLQASPMLADNEVNVYVAGHAIRLQINDEIAAREYTNMGVEHLGVILSAAREVNNWLSKVYTGYSPDFILTNPIRDAIQGAITLTGERGILTTAKIFANYPLALKELAKHFAKPGSSQIVKDYRMNGGSTGGAYLSDLERIGNDLQASYDEYAGSLAAYKTAYDKAVANGKNAKAAHLIAATRAGIAGFKNIPVIGHFVRLMEHMNALTENALRVATFHTLVQGGETKARAAAQAKNLMNFNRKGEMSNVAGAMYLFFNPSVQGTALIKQALVSSPHKHQAQALAGSMVLAAMAVAALALSGDDDDKRKWLQTPSNVRDGNVVINAGDKQITITLPYGYRMFWTLGNVISDAGQGVDPHKLGIRLASSVFSNLSPMGNPFEGDHPVMQMMPTVVKMMSAAETNEDSFGSKIAPDKHQQALPDSQNMNRATHGTLYAGITEKLNELTGGTKYEKGAVDVSPEVMKFWVKSLTGGTGQFAMDMVNLTSGAAQGVGPQAMRDIPVARRFVRDIGVGDARKAYWDRANEVKEAAGQVALAKKARDGNGMDSLLDRKGELAAMAKYTEGTLKLANSYREESDAIRQDGTLSLKEKQTQMKALEAEEASVYQEYINVFDTEAKSK